MARPAGSRQGASVRVDAALAAVRRSGFLPRSESRRAAADRPIDIGYGQTNSQPTTVRTMLVLLDVHHGDRVLDVGSGSAWTTALLASLAGSSGRVYGVELVPELVEFGSANLAVHLNSHRTRLHPVGTAQAARPATASIQLSEPGRLGLPRFAPYDKILVSAEAGRLPQQLVDQLRPGGRMVIPVAGRLSVLDRDATGETHERRVGRYAFVPLR